MVCFSQQRLLFCFLQGLWGEATGLTGSWGSYWDFDFAFVYSRLLAVSCSGPDACRMIWGTCACLGALGRGWYVSARTKKNPHHRVAAFVFTDHRIEG